MSQYDNSRFHGGLYRVGTIGTPRDRGLCACWDGAEGHDRPEAVQRIGGAAVVQGRRQNAIMYAVGRLHCEARGHGGAALEDDTGPEGR